MGIIFQDILLKLIYFLLILQIQVVHKRLELIEY